MKMSNESYRNKYIELCSILSGELNEKGFWSGELSSSALSTAIAIVALKITGKNVNERRIALGYKWLAENINSDGGFGDTPCSESNVSTSLICLAAVHYCKSQDVDDSLFSAIEGYLKTKNISLDEQDITSNILRFYGNDFTFSVPILSMLMVCGILPEESVKKIPQLPYQLSLLPTSLYRFFKLQVVSYAIPALIGVGIYTQSVRKKRSKQNFVRQFFIQSSLGMLTSLMPESGGFLEAIPLTGFVCMCLTASGNSYNDVVRMGIVFLENQQRKDGSWPIDTNLSTWVTTLSIKALGSQLSLVLPYDKIDKLRKHLLSVQYKSKHKFNGAGPGGWGWTSFEGSVPDADDTPGAILSLHQMYQGSREEAEAIINGCKWLIDLQNSDGGFPTFCRGWGKLPFDSSCPDLTGHALLAIATTYDKFKTTLSKSLQRKISRSIVRALLYLHKCQSDTGYWLPLWFGNQLTEKKKNPVYGTARVSVYLEECLTFNALPGEVHDRIEKMVLSAKGYLESQQNTDGSWGGEKGIKGSIEETSLAISALAETHGEKCVRGFEWLSAQAVTKNMKPTPIGLYFASLWYHEKMYPLVFYTEALRKYIFTENKTIENSE
jgi:prenyltransferase beta subunit